jgi:hypothetical protein
VQSVENLPVAGRPRVARIAAVAATATSALTTLRGLGLGLGLRLTTTTTCDIQFVIFKINHQAFIVNKQICTCGMQIGDRDLRHLSLLLKIRHQTSQASPMSLSMLQLTQLIRQLNLTLTEV